MPRRLIDPNGATWEVALAGLRTQLVRDEIILEFRRVDEGPAERRTVRFSPKGAQAPERAYEEASEALLLRLLASSQPTWTSPEAGYSGHP